MAFVTFKGNRDTKTYVNPAKVCTFRPWFNDALVEGTLIQTEAGEPIMVYDLPEVVAKKLAEVDIDD